MQDWMIISAVVLLIVVNQFYTQSRLKDIVLKLRAGEYKKDLPFFISLLYPSFFYTLVGLLLGNLVWIVGILFLLIQIPLTNLILMNKILIGAEREKDSSPDSAEKAQFASLYDHAKKMLTVIRSNILIYIVALLFLSTAVFFFGRDMRQIGKGVNMRSGAGTENAVLTVLEAGDWVELVGEDGNWKRILSGGNEGYIYNTYLLDYLPDFGKTEEE